MPSDDLVVLETIGMRKLAISLAAFASSTLLATAMTFAPAAVAQDKYPQGPIKMVIPLPPGGSTDIIGRLIANKLTEELGQPVVVDNRAGASGIIGSQVVATAPADGQVLLFAYSAHTSLPHLYAKIPYEPVKSFAPVSLISTQSLVLVVPASLPVNNIKEFLAYLKANKGKVNAGIATSGSSGHIATEAFKLAVAPDIVSVVYKGGGPAQVALLANEVQMVFATTTQVLPLVKSGRLKALAVSAKTRSSYLPDVPTLVESGLKDVEVTPWQGIMVPAGTPRPVIDRLNAAIVNVLKQPDTLKQLAMNGTDPVGSTPAELAAWVDREMAYFGKVIKAAGIKAE